MVRGRSVAPGLFLIGSLALHGVAGGAAWLVHRSHARAPGQVEREAKPVFAGESFDVQAATEPQPAFAAPTDEAPKQPATPGEKKLERSHAPRALGTTGAAAAEEPPTYGAVGDRSAVDLVVAISRAFPQAASTDPVWATVPLGSAGEAEMEIDRDASGNVVRWSLDSGASGALRRAMVRTMALVTGRALLARGPTTKLRLSARVSTDAVRDGADSVYALHSEHEGRNASAYFSLSIGRRIDLVLHER